MCSPTLLLIGATALTGVGQIQAGMAANEAGKANARIQRRLAADAIARGDAEAQDQQIKNAAFKGEQAAAFGASGAEIESGSSLNILADTAELGKLDELRIRNNAQREAFALESGAAISEAEGSNARTSSFLTAGGTLLGGAGQVASKWKVFKADNKTGTFTDFLLDRSPKPRVRGPL